MPDFNPSQSPGRALLLAIGDVHLGTRCSGLPDDLSSKGIEPGELTPAQALADAVDLAIGEKVDAVLFAGDLVESVNARFEALAPLEESVKRLIGAGIAVIAVAGNHDVEALPRLADMIEGFTLLGRGGQWESRVISRDGRDLVEITGWSFGAPRVMESPLARLLAAPLEKKSAALPRIGLLHADLDVSGGAYAPIRQGELDQTGFDAWLLGHIHKPSLGQSPAAYPGGYLGSLIALDPSETGPRGPWLITVSGPGDVRVEQIIRARLRWEQLSVSVDGVGDAEDVPDLVLARAEDRVRQLDAAGQAPRALGPPDLPVQFEIGAELDPGLGSAIAPQQGLDGAADARLADPIGSVDHVKTVAQGRKLEPPLDARQPLDFQATELHPPAPPVC